MTSGLADTAGIMIIIIIIVITAFSNCRSTWIASCPSSRDGLQVEKWRPERSDGVAEVCGMVVVGDDIDDYHGVCQLWSKSLDPSLLGRLGAGVLQTDDLTQVKKFEGM